MRKYLILLCMFLSLFSCKQKSLRSIEIKDKRNGNICRVFPNFPLSKIKLNSIPNNLKFYLASCDIIICDSNPFLTNDEKKTILKRDLTQFIDGDILLDDVISNETFVLLDSLLMIEEIPIIGLSYWKPWTIAHFVLPKYIVKKEHINVIDYDKYFRENISIDKCVFIGNYEDKLIYYSRLPFTDQEGMIIDAINNYFDPQKVLKLIEYNDSGDYVKMDEIITMTFQDPLGQKFQKELYQPMRDLLKQEIIQNLIEHKNIVSYFDINVIFGEFGIFNDFMNNENYEVTLH